MIKLKKWNSWFNELLTNKELSANITKKLELGGVRDNYNRLDQFKVLKDIAFERAELESDAELFERAKILK